METTASLVEQNPGYANRWRSLFFICISLLVVSLDNTILNVAIPSISRDLGATGSELQWIIDSYILVFAALLLTLGALGASGRCKSGWCCSGSAHSRREFLIRPRC
jgi:MFS family permease